MTKNAVAGLVDFPGAEDGHVAGEGGFHQVGFAVEDAGFSRGGKLDHGSVRGVPGREGAGLNEGVASGGGEEGRDARAGGADSFGDGALGAELDGDLAREVLLFELFVGAEVRHDHAVDLAVFGEKGEAAATFGAGVVGDCGEGVEGFGAAAADGGDEGC